MTASPKTNKVRRSSLQRYAAAPHMVWTALFISAPIIFGAYYAFTATVDGAVVFSFENIKTFFKFVLMTFDLNQDKLPIYSISKR